MLEKLKVFLDVIYPMNEITSAVWEEIEKYTSLYPALLG